MKVLVAYASTHGSTEEIADVIADTLTGDGIVAEARDAAGVDSISGYDAFVLGSAIYYGHWLPAARVLAHRCSREAPFVPLWRFSSGPLTTPEPPPLPLPLQLPRPADDPTRPADRRIIFGGRLSTNGLDVTERSLVRLTGLRPADYRDWDEIRDWAQRIRAELAAFTERPQQRPAPLDPQLRVALHSVAPLPRAAVDPKVR